MPKTVGLTGGIGAGKSTVAKLLADCGAEVVEGDQLGKDAIDLQPEVQQAIRERFGDEVFSSAEQLNRRALAEKVFTDESHVRWLTELTFPYIHRKWRETVAESDKAVIVFDAALIFEWEIQKEFDIVLVVIADSANIAKRAVSGRFSPEIVEQRQRFQIPVEHKAEQADVILENSGTMKELSHRVNSLYKSWINQ